MFSFFLYLDLLVGNYAKKYLDLPYFFPSFDNSSIRPLTALDQDDIYIIFFQSFAQCRFRTGQALLPIRLQPIFAA